MEKERPRNWDWLTAVLLFLLMQVAAARLVTTDWAPYLYFAERMAALGTILGLALGASRFGRRAVFWLAFAYTVVVVPWQISSAAEDKLLLDRLARVGGILQVSLGQFMQRQPVKESLFFVAFVALVFWLLCILAGYAAARKRDILTGVIPAGAIVLVIQVYANYQLRGSWWLGAYLLVALLLIGRGYFRANEKTWAERRVYVNDEAWMNIMGGLFTVVASVIVIAWIFPTSISSVQPVTDAWTRMTRNVRDRLSNAVTSLKGPGGTQGSNFYGTSLALGENAAEGDAPVFSVHVVKDPASYLRYYWRGRVYDTYSDGEWTTSSFTTLGFEPTFSNLPVVDVQNRSEADLRFTVQFPTQSLIYAPGAPVWLDRAANVQVTPVESGLNDVLSWEALSSIPGTGSYEVKSEIGDPTVEDLRAAPSIYPKWVQQRYLQVPDSVRPAMQALAEQVTSGQKTSYDKAVKITQYLRAALQYSTNVPAAPRGQDPIEWVLFDYKKGFCNYYASAEVLMLRSIGVPARLAVGFAQGQSENGDYIVRRRDAHAWPEVFFPGLGWVEFEPTASQLQLTRIDTTVSNSLGGIAPQPTPRGEPEEGTGSSPITPLPRPAVPFGETLAARVLLIVLLVIAAALALYILYRNQMLGMVPVLLDRAFTKSGLSTPGWVENWVRWNQLEPVERAFAPVNWSLRSLGKTPAVHTTAIERAASLKQLLPSATEHIEAVAAELETGLFTPETPDVPRARRAGFLILLHLLRTRVNNFLGM
jgi:transglutaminase-like putative cysteine protease